MLLQEILARRRPIERLLSNVAVLPIHIPRCKAKSRWRSVDAHFSDIVGMLFPPLF